MTVLLAGTSGTGKSTLAGLLAARLGITTVVSTDSVRNMLRSFAGPGEDPLLWASTYEARPRPRCQLLRNRTLGRARSQPQALICWQGLQGVMPLSCTNRPSGDVIAAARPWYLFSCPACAACRRPGCVQAGEYVTDAAAAAAAARRGAKAGAGASVQRMDSKQRTVLVRSCLSVCCSG